MSYKGAVSKIFEVHKGVPQGSHLGPLLFCLFINDLFDAIQHSLKLGFADDLKTARIVNNIKDAQLLQQDIDTVVEWSKSNKLDLNIDKFQLMRFRKGPESVPVQYKVDGHILEPVETIKDLGVIFDSQLTFRHHCHHIMNSAYKVLGMVTRKCHDFKSTKAMFVLYNAFVRSKLEYASVVWNNGGSFLSELEKVQKRFLRFVYYKKHGVYPHYLRHPVRTVAMLKEFEYKSLNDRRLINDQVFLHKVVNGAVDCPDILGSLQFRAPPRVTRLQNLFHEDRHRGKILHQPPALRIMTSFNSLNSAAPLDPFQASVSAYRRGLLKRSI